MSDDPVRDLADHLGALDLFVELLAASVFTAFDKDRMDVAAFGTQLETEVDRRAASIANAAERVEAIKVHLRQIVAGTSRMLP